MPVFGLRHNKETGTESRGLLDERLIRTPGAQCRCCRLCGQVFSSQRKLDEHVRLQHLELEKELQRTAKGPDEPARYVLLDRSRHGLLTEAERQAGGMLNSLSLDDPTQPVLL